MTKPAGTVANDVLIAAASLSAVSTCTVTPPAGWTQITSTNTGASGDLLVTLYHVAGGAEPASYSFGTSCSPTGEVSIAAYMGVDTATPIAGSSTNFNAFSNAVSTPSIAVPGSAVALFFVALQSLPPGLQMPAGYSQVWGAANFEWGELDHDLSTVTTTVPGVSITYSGGTNAWAATELALTPAPRNTGAALATLNGSGYAVLGQGTIAFPPTTLNGTNQTLSQTATAVLDLSDASGAGLGWNITAQVSTLFTNTSHSVADGATTNTSTTVTSATAGFSAADTGLFITAPGIPAAATVVSVSSATTVVISAAATATGSSLALKIFSTMPNATISLASRTALTCDAGSTCSVGTDPATLTYPKPIPNTPTPATKVLNASVGTGMGNMGGSSAQTWSLGGAFAANAVRVGVYTATVTYTMSGGI